MFYGFCRLLDRLAIGMACASVREASAVFSHAKEARTLLAAPDFFQPPVIRPQVEFHGRIRFSFRSSHPTPWPENNQVRGRLYRAPGRWRDRPALLLLHGWNGEWQYTAQFPYLAWRLRRKGWNVVTMELPYHGRRRPTQAGAVRDFLSADLFRMVGAVQQSLADVRALLRWLEGEGVPTVGLWGISLGAWLAGFLACQESTVSCAVLMTPVARMDLAIAQLPFFEPVRESLAAQRMDLDSFNLHRHTPRLSPEKMLLVAGVYDLFSPLETVVDLWQGWRQPTLWRLPHGHISMLFSLPVLERTVAWLEQTI